MQTVYASLSLRIKAATIDFVVVILWVILIPTIISTPDPSFNLVRSILILPSLFLYEPLLVFFYSSTLGHRLLGLRIVTEDEFGRVSFSKAFGRWTGKALFGLLSIAYMFFGRKHQMIHDKLTKTVVILDPHVVEKNPDFAAKGEIELVEKDGYEYPPIWRRFLIFIVWYLIFSIPAAMVFYILSNLLGISDSQDIMVNKQERSLESLIDFILIIVTAMLASRGMLPGAKRQKRDSNEE